MRTNKPLRTAAALAAVTALLAACSEAETSDDDADATSASSPSSTDPTPSAPDESSAPPEEELPDGVLALPGRDPGSDFASLAAGRYRVPLNDSLAFEVDLPDGTTAHDDGLFLATKGFVLKTEVAGDLYGVPRNPCNDQVIEPAGPTVDDLVQAIGNLPIYQLTRPEPTELGGAEGTYIEARIPRTYDASECDDDRVQLPGNPTTAVNGPPPYIGRWWILDVDGQRVVVQQNCWGCPADQFDRSPSTPQSVTFTPTP